jgi:aminoglycoside phosphotransferase (APT) family kinase protein
MSRRDDVFRVVARYRPGYRVLRIAEIGEGTDHDAYEVNGELVVRFGTDPDAAQRAASTRREARLLCEVAARTPLATPVPQFVLPEAGCLIYRKLPGVPLMRLPARRRRLHVGVDMPPTLGAFLTAVHGMSVSQMADLADVDDVPLEQWRLESADAYAAVAAHLPTDQRRAVEAFLASPVPDERYDPAFCHNDLGAEHLLADPATWRLSAVIDWGDAAITDPAHDFGLLLRDLGSRALADVIGHYNRDVDDRVALHSRAVFYARCKTLEDLAYGLDAGRREYVDNGLAALTWLFDPDPAGVSDRSVSPRSA